MAVLNLLCCMDFSLVAPSRGYSDCSAWASHSCSSYCGTGASLLLACEIHPDRSSNLCPLHWQVDSLSLSHRGSPHRGFHCKKMLRFLFLCFCFMFCALFWEREWEPDPGGWSVGFSKKVNRVQLGPWGCVQRVTVGLDGRAGRGWAGMCWASRAAQRTIESGPRCWSPPATLTRGSLTSQDLGSLACRQRSPRMRHIQVPPHPGLISKESGSHHLSGKPLCWQTPPALRYWIIMMYTWN